MKIESDISVTYWKRKTEIERILRRIYTREFRKQAVCLHKVNRKTTPEIAKHLYIAGRDTEELGLCGYHSKAGREARIKSH